MKNLKALPRPNCWTNPQIQHGFTLLKDGKLSWKAAQAGFVAINLKSIKRPPKLRQSTGREIVLDKVKTFQQARNMALEILGDLGHDAQKSWGKQGVCKGKMVRRETAMGNAGWRLDWDPVKGPHINIDDFRKGKKAQALEIAIPFEGDESTVKSLLKHLNK